jgi:hypothetical protein
MDQLGGFLDGGCVVEHETAATMRDAFWGYSLHLQDPPDRL